MLLLLLLLLLLLFQYESFNSSFRREVDENSALLGYYAARGGNSLQTFRDKISVPSSSVIILCKTTVLLFLLH
jgi:hypothetical protein